MENAHMLCGMENTPKDTSLYHMACANCSHYRASFLQQSATFVNPFNPPIDKIPRICIRVGWQFTFQSHHNDSPSMLQTSHPMVI